MDAVSTPESPMTPGIPHWLRGGSALYLASAASILIGVYQLIVPAYANPDIALEKMWCIAALNTYELMLLGVALLILLWRRVVDDAVALAGLIAAFLVASAVALDTIAPDFAGSTLAFGAAGFLLALGKLYAMDAYVTGGMRGLRLLGLAVLLLWNFTTPGLMGLVNEHHMICVTRQVWLGGGLVVLAGAVVLVMQAIRQPAGEFHEMDDDKPFLETSKMHWVFAAIVLAGTFVHQYALGWAFNAAFELGDTLAAFCVAALLIFELRRAYARRVSRLNILVLLLPLAAVWIALSQHAYTVSLGWRDLGTLYYPSVVATVMGVAIEVLAFLRRRSGLHAIASLYLLTGLGHLGWKLYELIAIRFGWMMVGLSFVVLCFGATASLIKGRAAEEMVEPEPAGN